MVQKFSGENVTGRRLPCSLHERGSSAPPTQLSSVYLINFSLTARGFFAKGITRMFCQKCRQPLRLDGSIEDLNPAAYDLLVCRFSSDVSSQLELIYDPTSFILVADAEEIYDIPTAYCPATGTSSQITFQQDISECWTTNLQT